MPVCHSLSPKIHTLFAEQFQHALNYQAIEVNETEFVSFVNSFFQQGGKGLNITVPHKQTACQMLDTLSDAAERAGAVNTIHYDGDKLKGYNTDGAGLICDLQQNLQLDLAGQELLILGAGGAVRGVLLPLIEQQPASITIANRTLDRAVALKQLFSDKYDIRCSAYEALEHKQFDIVINGTSSSLQNTLPPLPDNLFSNNAVSYDMMYASDATLFQSWSRQQGVSLAYDGLGMLVEQAAEAYLIWCGVRPETKSVLTTLRQTMNRND